MADQGPPPDSQPEEQFPASSGTAAPIYRTRSNSFAQAVRRASISFMEAPMPSGFFQVAGEISAQARMPTDIERDDLAHAAHTKRAEMMRRNTIAEEEKNLPVEASSSIGPVIDKEATSSGSEPDDKRILTADEIAAGVLYPGEEEVTLTKWQATVKFLAAFWKWFLTPMGFLITLYFLLVVAWGGMIFLLLCNAAPAMRGPYGASDNRSARSKWIEIDSQILNALFCVTGFGLIPWRFRDFYYLMRYRIKHDPVALNHLANIHRGWFRADDKGPRTYPLRYNANDEEDLSQSTTTQLTQGTQGTQSTYRTISRTRTGKYAGPSAIWKLDLVIWFYVWNTIFQAVLAGGMWGLNRFDRPAWYTAIFIVLGFGVAIAAGVVIGIEGRRIKKVEGSPLRRLPLDRISEEDKAEIIPKKTGRKWWQFIDRDN
ncbi:hypothetical protein DRE_00703 [Drechslerella stenobrocha 248]|uniref:Uncharacterized protein n=1 Tax=Drechslerella stenobrocha 248 TaxID=1043628 RepID=W7HQ70_9PEZI|nr:hypothetical protein DRE_00703 [Drechslerella stenobrocha 248]